MKKIALLTALVGAVVTIPAVAKEKPPVFVEQKAVKDAPAVTLDPAKAYVLLRTAAAMPVHFVRIPTAEEQQRWEKLKADAFAEAREDYTKKLARYESALEQSHKSPGISVPAKPLEPTEANFEYVPFARMANFTIGAFNRFNSKDGSVYLHAVTPGIYRLYGQLDPLLGGGLCFCMGSVTFEAPAGKIVDLGMLGEETFTKPDVEKGDSSTPALFARAAPLKPATTESAVDPRLASLPRVPASYHAAGKIPNYFGVAISRIPAIEGVIRYDRDRIIDPLTAQQSAQVASPAH